MSDGRNLNAYVDNAHMRTGVPTPRLEHVDIELTRDCNLSCRHCSVGLDTQGKEMSFARIQAILQEAESLGLETVGLTGGEPFLRFEKLKKLVDYCTHELKSHVHIHSNGTKISDKEALWLKQSEVDTTISFFGKDPKTHDSVTNTEGSMKATMNGLRKLVDADASLSVFIVPMKPNFHEIFPLIKLIQKEGANHVRVLSLSPTGKALRRYEQLRLSDDEVSFVNKELARARKEINIDLRAGFCTRLIFPSLEVLRGHEQCYAAENRIHIDAFGDIFPCTASSGRMIFSAGNLQMSGYTLTEIWRASPLFQFLRRFHSDPPRKCRTCLRFHACMSGCRVKTSYEYGDATIADPQCGGPYVKTTEDF